MLHGGRHNQGRVAAESARQFGVGDDLHRCLRRGDLARLQGQLGTGLPGNRGLHHRRHDAGVGDDQGHTEWIAPGNVRGQQLSRQHRIGNQRRDLDQRVGGAGRECQRQSSQCAGGVVVALPRIQRQRLLQHGQVVGLDHQRHRLRQIAGVGHRTVDLDQIAGPIGRAVGFQRQRGIAIVDVEGIFGRSEGLAGAAVGAAPEQQAAGGVQRADQL